jgi:hypothetical protein
MFLKTKGRSIIISGYNMKPSDLKKIIAEEITHFKKIVNEGSRRDPESIRKEYEELKKHSMMALVSAWSRINKVGNPKSLDREGLISDLLRAKHGNKYVDKAFESVNEGIGSWTSTLEDLLAFGFGNLSVKFKGRDLGKVKDFKKLGSTVGPSITIRTFNYLLKKGGLKHDHKRNRAELGPKSSKFMKGSVELTEGEVNEAKQPKEKDLSIINKARAKAALRQIKKGKRDDGMGKFTDRLFGVSSSGEVQQISNEKDINMYKKFGLAESVNEGQDFYNVIVKKTGKIVSYKVDNRIVTGYWMEKYWADRISKREDDWVVKKIKGSGNRKYEVGQTVKYKIDFDKTPDKSFSGFSSGWKKGEIEVVDRDIDPPHVIINNKYIPFSWIKESVNEAEFKHINKDEHKIKLAIKDVEKKSRLKANRDKTPEYEQEALNKIMLSKVLGREKLSSKYKAAWTKLKKNTA